MWHIYMCMLKSHINSFSQKLLHAQAKQSYPVSSVAFSGFLLACWMELLLDRLQEWISQTEKERHPRRACFHGASARTRDCHLTLFKARRRTTSEGFLLNGSYQFFRVHQTRITLHQASLNETRKHM